MQVTKFKSPIIFEVNIKQKVNIGPRSTTKVVFRKFLNFHPIDLKFEEDLYFMSLNSTSQLFLRSKGQHRPKVNNLGEISKILSFHPIDLKFEEDLYFMSMNSTSQLFLRSKGQKVNIGQRSTT